jgi:aminopeptidase N
MVIPLAIGLLGQNGGDMPLMLDGRPLERGVLTLKEPSQGSIFSGIADLRFLAAHDSDPFNRWQAEQTLAMSLLATNVAALRKGSRYLL